MWNALVDRVTPYIVKIETPRGHGTGFLCLYNEERVFCGIATAWHVISYAHEWQEPIKLSHYPSKTSAFLKANERVIFSDPGSDSAVIVISTGRLQLPDTIIPLLPIEKPLAIGDDVGWLGYPALAEYDLCFFSGIISARQEWRHGYLIDGVAINGVSGGPVIYSTEADGVQIVGTISAYVSNRATGDTLPGLSIARDVSHFHDTISKMRSIDEASRQQKLQAEEQKSKASIPPTIDSLVPEPVAPPPEVGANPAPAPVEPAKLPIERKLRRIVRKRS